MHTLNTKLTRKKIRMQFPQPEKSRDKKNCSNDLYLPRAAIPAFGDLCANTPSQLHTVTADSPLLYQQLLVAGCKKHQKAAQQIYMLRSASG